MHTRHVESYYETYHGNIFDQSYVAYIYEGPQEHEAMKQLVEEALPKLIEHRNTRQSALAEHTVKEDAKLIEEIDFWTAQSFWYKLKNAKPHPPCYPNTDEATNIRILKDRIEEAEELKKVLENSENHAAFFCYEDKNNRVTEALLEAMRL